MNRVIFVNRYFYPDHSATSQIVSGLAFHLAQTGADVHVVTGQQLYNEPAAILPLQDAIRGVHVHRVATTRFGRTGLPGRAVDYLSFYVSAGRKIVEVAKRRDLLITKTDPPLLSVLGARLAPRTGARLINWLQDVYPETAVQLGVPFVRGPIEKFLVGLRDTSLRSAAMNVAVGERMAEFVVSRGVPQECVEVIPNWSDDEDILPVPHEQNPLRKEWNLGGKFVVGYSGNLGRAHEYETLLSAAERLRSDNRFLFLFVGSGHHAAQLEGRVKARGLAHLFQFQPYQQKETLKYSLSAADVHWVSLRPELEGFIVPSKFYGIAAAGRPTIAITAPDGEIARSVQKYRCGLHVQVGDSAGLVHALTWLAGEPQLTAEMGRCARDMLVSHFAQREGLERWVALLNRLY